MSTTAAQCNGNLTDNDFPNKIKMSGLPFVLQGWNTTFSKTKDLSDGAPIYRLEPYSLYFTIPIIGGSVKKVNGKWIFVRDYDFGVNSGLEKVSPGNCFPFGEWSYGAKIVPIY